MQYSVGTCSLHYWVKFLNLEGCYKYYNIYSDVALNWPNTSMPQCNSGLGTVVSGFSEPES